MDSALSLRIAKEKNELRLLNEKEIESLLNESKILNKLTKDYEDNNFFCIFRILCLSEIPFAQTLQYTQKIINYISSNLARDEGFSYTGKIDDIVPCYNAMLLEAYTNLGHISTPEVINSLNWIKKYQVFDRNESTSWPYKGICKHGGCMNSIPCYIGIGKTTRALITYSDTIDKPDIEVEKLIDKGISYLLKHQMFKRLSNGKPISAHITDNMFPQNYALSFTDLCYIVGKRNLMSNPNTIAFRELLMDKEIAKNEWKIEYIYSHNGYKSFDSKRSTSTWLSALYPLWLDL